jgi:hypothetical protein
MKEIHFDFRESVMGPPETFGEGSFIFWDRLAACSLIAEEDDTNLSVMEGNHFIFMNSLLVVAHVLLACCP